MKRLLTMALVLAMMATMLVVTPVAFAADVAMTLTATPSEDGNDVFSASFTGVEDATWVVWTVYATNNDNTDPDVTSDDEMIFVDEKRGNRAAEEGFDFTFAFNTETVLNDKTPFKAEAKIYFADSSRNTTETGEFVYLPYAEIQEIIKSALKGTKTIAVAAAELGVTLPSCYLNDTDFDALVVDYLLNHSTYAARQYNAKKDTVYVFGNESTNIVPAEFYADLESAILFAAVNSEDVTTISNLLASYYSELGIDAVHFGKYDTTENKDVIDAELAGHTYETIVDFINQFKALVFLDELSTKNQVDIISFIRNNYSNYSYYASQPDHLDTPTALDLDFVTFDSYTTTNADNLARAEFVLADSEYDSLETLKNVFDGLITEFSTPITPDPDPDPGYTPGASSGPTVSVTPSKPIVGEDAPKFTDIDDVVWAHEAINTLAKEGVIVGVTNTQFQPNAEVTREQFVQIIVKTFDLKGTGVAAPFADVDQKAWYAESINTAYELGIVKGISEDEFGIGNTITRQDMATIMYRVANTLGIKIEENFDRELKDADSINDYASVAVNALYKSGIINGVADGIFAGSQIATRAQAAKLCYDLREAK